MFTDMVQRGSEARNWLARDSITRVNISCWAALARASITTLAEYPTLLRVMRYLSDEEPLAVAGGILYGAHWVKPSFSEELELAKWP